MNRMYARGLFAFMNALDWVNDPFKVLLVTPSIIYNPNHQYLSYILAAERLGSALISGRATYIVNKEAVAGGDATTVSITQAGVLGAGIIYHDSGVEATSELVAFIDEIVGVGSQLSTSELHQIEWATAINGGIFSLMKQPP